MDFKEIICIKDKFVKVIRMLKCSKSTVYPDLMLKSLWTIKVREFANLLIRCHVCFRRTELLKELTDLHLKLDLFSEESKRILSL